jgi:hypothetical protein
MLVADVIKILTGPRFQSCYEVWEIHWVKCLATEGNYFEGDNIDLYE